MIEELKLRTPVAFIIFNRPETTVKVFAEIAKVKPPKLLVIADGPRKNQPEDVEKCTTVRKIIDNVDWNCDVLTNYSDKNLGCKVRISSGIDWVFNNVDEAIILEDDCLPHQTFFRFCEELLEKYRDDKRIAMISGNNFQFGRKRTEYSYYFSRYPHIWGWATWRRSWNNYDVYMKLWPEIRDKAWLYDILGDKKSVWYWKNRFDNTYKGHIDTWDYQWTFSCWIQNALDIIPNVNLVSNIGFSDYATHTVNDKFSNKFSNLGIEPMNIPILHPSYILRDTKADSFVENEMFSGSLMFKAINNLKNQIIKKRM